MVFWKYEIIFIKIITWVISQMMMPLMTNSIWAWMESLAGSICRSSRLSFLNLVISTTAGQQNRRQIPWGTRTNHDFSQVQHPEVLPGSGHHTLCSPRCHGRQWLLRPLRQNVSIVSKHFQINPETGVVILITIRVNVDVNVDVNVVYVCAKHYGILYP